MAAINFPDSPNNGDRHTVNGKTWEWNTVSWISVNEGIAAEDTYSSTSSITPNMDTTGIITVTALATGLTINNPTGTISQGERLIIRIKDSGGAQSLSFDTQYRASSDLALPTTTITGKTLYLGFVWNSTDTKFDLIALLNNF